MDSANLFAHWIKARLLLHLGNKSALDGEIAALKAAIRELGGLDGRWFLYHLQGEIALQKQNFNRAIESFRKALDLKPQDRSFYLTALGKAYEEAGKLSEALKQYDAALEFNPNNAHAAFAIASTYEKSGQQVKAKGAYKRALEIWSEADEGIAEIDIARDKISTLRI
ncbi:tetratricopeptide repeat protein [candidate division KSB1 bacterium]|nr:tetratricopeptide repeat protein [candidate division KSB1 bacterium]